MNNGSKVIFSILAMCLWNSSFQAQDLEEEIIKHHKDFLRCIALPTRKESPFLVATGIKHPLFNVAPLNHLAEDIDFHIQRLVQGKQTSRLPISCWFPLNEKTKKIEELLQKNGFFLLGYFYAWSYDFNGTHFKHVLPGKLQALDRLKLVKVNTLEQAELWGTILQQSMGYSAAVVEKYVECVSRHALAPDPIIDMYLAYYQGRAIGTALTFYKDDLSTVADLCIVPEHRLNGFSEELCYKLLSNRQPYTVKAIGIASMAGEKVIQDIGCQLHSFIAIYMLL